MAVEYTFETFDGIKLFGKTDAIDDPRAVVVIVHGLCEHQGRYDYLTMRLNAQGYSVYRFDHRGHGRSEGQKIYYSNYEEIARDVDVVVERAMEENPFAPVFIIGHSMGGYASALYGTMFPGKVDGYVLSGAWTRDNKGLTKAAVEAQADDLVYIPNELGDGVCSDPAVGRAYVADPYVIMEMSLGLFRAVNAGQKWMKENAAQFCDPVILLHGADDGLVDVKDSLEFFQDISSTDKSLRVYAGLLHEIFNEYDKDAVIKDAIDWLNLHASLIDYGFEEFFEEVIEESAEEEA
ncbi:MAG: lysophospholipase, partial [Eggerthellaceae bacterium]|nr:lysophospholipase [Eggerthellaceae bacterium]